MSLQIIHHIFQKKFISPKMVAILNFAKIAKYKTAYISKTVLDRAISTKFLNHRGSMQSSHPDFQNNFVYPIMAFILNFRIFRKNCKTQKCLYLENHVRQSDETFDQRCVSADKPSQFSKNFCLAKNGGHFKFSQQYKAISRALS